MMVTNSMLSDQEMTRDARITNLDLRHEASDLPVSFQATSPGEDNNYSASQL